MVSFRAVSLGVFVLVGLAGAPGVALSDADIDPKGTGQKKESVRKEKEGLLPPKEALERKDTDVPPDAYQPKGVDLGQFLLLPKLEAEVVRNSNIYATNYDAKHDIIHSYRPELVLNSRFDRHAVNAIVRGERKEYVNFVKEDVTNGFAQAMGRYDFGERDNLSGLISYTHDHEERGSPDDVNGLRPTEYHYLVVNPSAAVNTGAITSTLSLLGVKREWKDTELASGIAPSHLRNRNEYELKLREGYEFIPGYSAIVEGTVMQRRYVSKSDQSGFQRDNDGLRLSSGLAVDISEVVRGDFLVGYMQQDYTDSRLRDPSGLFVKALLNWAPTKLTTVIPSIERSIEETTAVAVSALVHTSVSVKVQHELERNLILGTTLSYSRDKQTGGELITDLYEARVRGTYLFNRNIYTTLEFGERHKIANLDGRGFNQTLGMLLIGAQY